MRTNALANLVARLWIAAMNFLFVPLYIRLLGIEAYGLIGFFTTLMAAFALLDLGLSLTINRELAQRAGRPDDLAGSRDLMRTLEVVYWGVALVVGGGIALAAPAIVHRWLNVRSMDVDAAIDAVRMMGLTALLRWPVPLYVGALLGLQRQLPMSVTTAAGSTLAAGGAALVLLSGLREVAAFFLWQAIAAGVMVMVLRAIVWRALAVLPGGPGDGQRHMPSIRWSSMRDTIGFSAGVTGITLLSIVVAQLDKFVLAQALPLGEFGYYALASAIAATVAIAGTTIEAATFPVMARLAAEDGTDGIARLYHGATQALALIVLPAAITIILFAPELLTFYVHDPVVVAGAAPLLAVLMAGHAVMALMFLPQSLQLAHGWTRLALYRTALSLLVFVPLLLAMVRQFGAMGGAVSWLALAIGSLAIEIPVMHRRLLPGEQWRWYGIDVGLPAALALLVVGTARLVVPIGASSMPAIAAIGAVWALTMIVCAFALPAPRATIRDWWLQR